MEIKFDGEVTGRIDLVVHSLPGNVPGTLTLAIETDETNEDDEEITVRLATVLTREEAVALMAELAQAIAGMAPRP